MTCRVGIRSSAPGLCRECERERVCVCSALKFQNLAKRGGNERDTLGSFPAGYGGHLHIHTCIPFKYCIVCGE